jgi:hypothetical protein
MKKVALSMALAIASLSSAQAQTTTPQAPEQARFFVGMGFTGGGDKIATIKYTDGDKGDVTFGSLIQLGAGVDYRVNDAFSLQASINDHVSSQGGSNGSLRFTRFPMELLAYYNVSPQWRVGLGARYVSGAKLKATGVLGDGSIKFDNTVGTIMEAEYAMNKQFGLKLRYVVEKYEVTGLSGKASGNHLGALVNYYF